MDVKSLLKKILSKEVMNKYRQYKKLHDQRILTNVFSTDYQKNCLIAYIIAPFITGIDNTHQNKWQVYELAKIISQYGYTVDVIDYDYRKKNFPHKYDLLIDIFPVGDRPFAGALKDDCVKIAYLTGSDHEFSTNAEKKRLERIKNERGVDLPIERGAVPISREIENMAAVFFIGNAYNLRSYGKFNLPAVFYIPNTGYKFSCRDNQRDRKAFLYFASSGQVHKGLDLCLEAFSQCCQDLELYICSSFAEEEEFCSCYYHELYECENIHAIGFVDIEGDSFQKIIGKCTWCIMPSCSEGIAGSVLTAMSGGIIPVLTPECGFDENEFIPIREDSVAGVVSALQFCTTRDEKWIAAKSSQIKKLTECKYSKGNYTKVITESLAQVLSSKGA